MLISYSHNARTHSKHQIRQIARSITEFGFTNPLLIDQNNTIIAGHGRLLAAQMLGMEQVPTIRLGTLTQSQIRAYVLADNKIAENAGWDTSILALELEQLLAVNEEIDITVCGFDIPKIDVILQESANATDPEDELPIEETGPAVAQPGDLWHLGRHRVLSGNSLQENSYKTLMRGKRAAIAFSDAPYNVPIGHVCGKGAVQHREFQMASGEMSEAEFVAFLSNALRLFAKYSASGSFHYLAMDWRHMKEMLAAGGDAYDSLLNLCVWTKNNGGMGSFYRSQHELIFVFKNGKGPHRNNVQPSERYLPRAMSTPKVTPETAKG